MKRKGAKEDTQEDEREKIKAHERSCPEEEYNSKQIDEAEGLGGEPRPGPVPVIGFQEIPTSVPEPARKDKNPDVHNSRPDNHLPDLSWPEDFSESA